MPNCPRCGKPVYFAERKTSLGKDWHPQCLRCEHCNKSLTPGQHSEHLNTPYCNACYQTLYGPEGFRAGTVEPRKVKVEDDEQSAAEKQEILAKIREYNLYKESPVEQIHSREVNGKVLFEGILKLYWGLHQPIILAPGVAYAKQRNSVLNRASIYDFVGVDDASYLMMLEEATRAQRRRTLYENERRRLIEISENSFMQSEERRQEELGELSVSYSSNSAESSPMHSPFCSPLNSPHNSPLHNMQPRRPPLESSLSLESPLEHSQEEIDGGSMSRSLNRADLMRRPRTGTQVRKRSASFRKVARQKKIEEQKDKERHKFTPPYGSSTNLRVSSTLKTKDVLAMLLAKFKVENDTSQFGLYIVCDGGIQEPCKDSDCPLMVRLRLGPNEDIAKIFVMEVSHAEEMKISAEVAEWIKFAIPELELFCRKFDEEEQREMKKIKRRFHFYREALLDRIKEIEGDETFCPVTDI